MYCHFWGTRISSDSFKMEVASYNNVGRCQSDYRPILWLASSWFFFCNNKKMLIPLINILASCNYEKRTASATLETLPHFLGLLNNEIITRQRSSGLKTQITLTSPCHLIKLSHRSTIFSHISLENNPVQTSDFGYKIGDLSLNWK